jgi:hypothetical protein
MYVCVCACVFILHFFALPKPKKMLARHYSYYLEDGMDILELGASEESYLPENIKLNRLLGVGLSPELMKQNPYLTERMVIDLNKVSPDVGVVELESLGSDSFDAILMANTIDFLTDPKEVFRQVCLTLLYEPL